MTALKSSFEIQIDPLPPYSFPLTVHNPAGWAFLTPFEVFEKGVLYTAAHIHGNLLGMELSSSGTPDDPHLSARIYSGNELSREEQGEVRNLMVRKLGADQDLKPFYSMAQDDAILKHSVSSLYGMHDTFPIDIFPEAILAITLQMAPLKRSNEMMESIIRNYGEVAEFNGKSVPVWPTPESLGRVDEQELSRTCKTGYRSKFLVRMAAVLATGDFPSTWELMQMEPGEAKKTIRKLPGIGDYSADIINPHGGFPIDVWSAEVFGELFFGKKPENNRKAVEEVKKEGLKRWGEWAWMAFFYVVQDIPGLSEKLGVDLRVT